MINKRIHIVDDELVIRESIGGWLSKKYEVFSYASGEEYLEATKKFNPKDQTLTCLLLDFQMTGINGVELQNQLKHLDANFSIIFMSGNAHQSDIIDAWHGGAIDFLLKPFSPIKINELLDKQFSLMEQRTDIGRAGFSLALVLTKHIASVECYIRDGNKPDQWSTDAFNALKLNSESIESKFGRKLIWDELPDRKGCRISFDLDGGWQSPSEEWPELQEKMIDLLVDLEAALKPEIQKLSI